MLKKFFMLAIALLVFCGENSPVGAAAFEPRFVTVDILPQNNLQLTFNFSGRKFGASGDFFYTVSRLSTNKKVAAGVEKFRYPKTNVIKFKYKDLELTQPEILKLNVVVNSKTVGTQYGARKLPNPEIGNYSFIIKFHRSHRGVLSARVSYGGAV